jgi:hypothetical protein
MQPWMSLAYMSRYAWICGAGVFSQRRRRSFVSGSVSEVLKCEVGFRGVTANEAKFGWRSESENSREKAQKAQKFLDLFFALFVPFRGYFLPVPAESN